MAVTGDERPHLRLREKLFVCHATIVRDPGFDVVG
jgi:hypothetical protein